ncbi:hypothetical protein P8452_19765 [Trifolium repens]|nr:hypothetical protein P8452_19765 [Trifolium repens]
MITVSNIYDTLGFKDISFNLFSKTLTWFKLGTSTFHTYLPPEKNSDHHRELIPLATGESSKANTASALLYNSTRRKRY